MDSSTYVTLSAQLALQKRLDVVANNVANTNTTGYKSDRTLFQSYVERLSAPGGHVTFVQDRGTYIDQANGPIQQTGNPLDLAVQGSGYLAVTTPQGTTQYTRNGHLHTASDGTLVDDAGRAVQDPDGNTIQLPQQYTAMEIKGDGTIITTVNGLQQNTGQIGLFRPADPLGVRKSGNGLFDASSGIMQPVDPGAPDVRVVQGALEGSTVQPVTEIARMTQLSRAYEWLQSMLSDDDDREQKMIQTLGTPT